MELLFARLARQLWQLIGVLMDHAVTDVALFDAFEFLVQVALPQRQPVEDRAVLVAEEEVQLHEHLLGLDATVDALAAFYLGHVQGIVGRQGDHQFHARLLLCVAREDLPGGVVHRNLDVVHLLALVDKGAQFLVTEQGGGVEHVELLNEEVRAVRQIGPAFANDGCRRMRFGLI